MSAGIEVAADGRAAFMTADEPAWHRLGETVRGAKTAFEAGKIAHLNDWDMRTAPLYAADPRNTRARGLSARTVVVPERLVGNMRTNPFTGEPEILGVVGSGYIIVQNEEMFALADAILDEAGEAHVETAGSLNGGRQVFMTIKLTGKQILVGGEDPHDLYLVVWTSHDGTTSLYAIITAVRVVCQNTLRMAMASAPYKFTMRHTSSITGRIQEAREALSLTFAYTDEFEREAERFLSEPFSEEMFAEYAKQLIPDPEKSEGWIKRAEAARGTMMEVFLEAPETEFGRRTKWGAYNAAVQYADWGRPARRGAASLGVAPDTFTEKAYSLLV